MAIVFSPYKYSEYVKKDVIVSSVLIDVSTNDLFEYLGNSENAQHWSSYVSQIETLNEDMISDGKKGSIRRCFGKEKGVIWDELILAVEQNKSRVLQIFNTTGFLVMVNNLVTEQNYEPINSKQTKLSFLLYIEGSSLSILDWVKVKIGAYKVSSIFDRNLLNIKRINEKSS